MVFASFLTWKDVLAYARTGAPLYYHAPLNYRPAKIRQARHEQDRYMTYLVKHRTIRVFPPGCTGRGVLRVADPFTADAGHLSRFMYPVEAPSIVAA